MGIKILSASVGTDGNLVLLLNKKSQISTLKSSNFAFTGIEGAPFKPTVIEFSTAKKIIVEIPSGIDVKSGFDFTYSASKKDRKSGIIQDKRGKDAPSFSATISPLAPEPDPLTNAWTYNGHTYQLVKSPKPWSSAKDDAIIRGGYLIEIDDSAENQQLFVQLQNRIIPSELNQTKSTIAGGGASYVWLGASDLQNEGVWIWENSGDQVTLESPPWGSGALGREPDNFQNQDGLTIGLQNWPVGLPAGQGLGLAGQWNDQAVIESYFYVVEYDQILPVA